ncbi:MAG: fumarylacetoacetate hydrolase family protein [Gammaproteobacteria bacterium]|nr:fumarylacetoacetate hydrolase family protein [Gammaproteobacteria bacterium]
MRWLSFERNGEASFGRVVDGGVVDAGRRTGIPTLKAAIARGLEDVAAEAGDSADCALDEITYLPTITDPDKILCVGLNYRDHQEETGRGGEDNPTIFVRFAAAQVGHLGKMLRPSESDSLDFEGEIALVIGRPGRRIAPANWLDHIAGFSCYNDGSVREYQRHTSQFTPGKNFAATGGFGPWMVTPDEIDDYDDIEITTRLNGEVMQNARSAQLVFGFPELVAYCSTFTELVPGDVIVTGTPGGVGAARNPPVFMDEGDTIEVDIRRIGTLRHEVVRD